MTEFSGPAWAKRFPTSKSTADLKQPFRSGAEAFIGACEAAGARVAVSATYRPAERAYLMHWAWLIDRMGANPSEVPHHDGVNIDWCWNGDMLAARRAAADMVLAYGIAYQPSLTSRHIQRRAIDMYITFARSIEVVMATGVKHLVTKQQDLWVVGKSYGVIKLISDAPHWSDDGH